MLYFNTILYFTNIPYVGPSEVRQLHILWAGNNAAQGNLVPSQTDRLQG